MGTRQVGAIWRAQNLAVCTRQLHSCSVIKDTEQPFSDRNKKLNRNTSYRPRAYQRSYFRSVKMCKMNAYFLIATIIYAFPSQIEADSSSSDGLTNFQRARLLNLHNTFRSDVAKGQFRVKDGNLPPATNMIELVGISLIPFSIISSHRNGTVAWRRKRESTRRDAFGNMVGVTLTNKYIFSPDKALHELPFEQHIGENLATATNRSMDYLVSLWIDEWKLSNKRDFRRLPPVTFSFAFQSKAKHISSRNSKPSVISPLWPGR